jgi:hypothetical protein
MMRCILFPYGFVLAGLLSSFSMQFQLRQQAGSLSEGKTLNQHPANGASICCSGSTLSLHEPLASGMSRICFTDQPPSFFLLGWVDPGLICSILTRARSIFLMMSSTVALQMNGLGVLFQACINASIACFRSGRRIAFAVNSLNQRSTKFNQLELVGTK